MLDVANIDLSYGASRCLRGVSMVAEPGRSRPCSGRNGVGKSSLLRAIMGLERIQAGSITWEGATSPASARPSAPARASATCRRGARSSHSSPCRRTCRRRSPPRRAARGVPADIFDLFPILRQFLRRRGGDLSGGQQQQLALARALCARPRLLILDEPTEGIQPSVIKDIARVIRHLSRDRGMAIVLVEQYYDFARELADLITVMVRGEVVLQGPADELSEEAVRPLLTV